MPVKEPHKHTHPLTVTGVHKSYGVQKALNDVSLDVSASSCIGLLGPNGAGKTTLLRICLGLTKADSGSVRLFNLSIPEDALKARTRLGVVPQSDMLDPDFNCIENLQVFGRYFGIERKTLDKRIPYLLAFAGLEKRSHESITHLSGGMQRRLTLSRALINDPEMLFLDEPTTGLDPQARHLIWERLRQLQAQGKTLLLVTHFMEEAERLCDYIYIMDDAKVIASGTPQDLIHTHTESEVIEVHGTEGAEWLRTNATLFTRYESFGATHYCYCHRPEAIIEALSSTSLKFKHRHANLEDVFLRLTGRELRE